MSVTRLPETLPGEQIVGIAPEMGLYVEADWQRRIHLYTGRDLSPTALTMEQTGRAGRLALSGQALSQGVITGLEVVLETETIPASEGQPETTVHRVQLQPGLGLTASGEDVVVMRATTVEVGNIPVFALRSLLGGDTTISEGSGDLALQPRALGPSLSEFVRDVTLPSTFPRAGVLVLQPITLAEVGEYDPDDPCEEDAANYAYEDQRLVDGCRVVLYFWPTEWRALPEPGDRWQNRIAYSVFEGETAIGPGGVLPWETVGLPIALIGFDETWQPVFVDRYAVVRDGGKYARRASLIAGTGDPFLWQARIRQFAEQAIAANTRDMGVLAAQFRYLPPVGIVPVQAIDPITHVNAFFPATYDLDIAPVPLEQLDLVFEASASLQAFDTFSPDQARVLVPVPQAVFEPGLLTTETISPEFQQTVDEFVTQRNEALRRRTAVRLKHSALVKAITGTAPTYPADGDRTEASELAAASAYSGGAHRSSLLAGMHQHFFDSATARLTVQAGERLFAWVYLDPDNPPREVMLQWNVNNWEHRAYWGEDRIAWGIPNTPSRHRIGALPATGRWLRLEVPAESVGLEGTEIAGMAFTLHDGSAAWGRTGKLVGGEETVWFSELLPAGAVERGTFEAWEFVDVGDVPTPLEADYDTELRPDAPPVVQPVRDLKTFLATTPLNKDTQAAPAEIDNKGLEAYIRLLDAKIARADDTVDFGFTRVQTDIYRVRQLVLNTEAATRLAVSPALASIARGESAAATKEEVASFYDRLKSKGTGQNANPQDGPDTLSAGGGFVAAEDFSSPFNLITDVGTTSFDAGAMVGIAAFGGGLIGSSTAISLALNEADTLFIPRGRQLTIDAEIPDGLLASNLRTSTSFLPTRLFDAGDIQEQAPIVGSAVIRSASIAERIEAPKAPEAKDFSAASHFDIVSNLINLGFEDGDNTPDTGISLADLQIPVRSVADGRETTGLQPITNFRDTANRAALLNPAMIRTTDEAAFFAVGVDVLDNAVAALRIIEGRVQAYRRARARCAETLEAVRVLARNANNRLRVIGDDLAEARHDVAVSRALKAEEEARLNAINERRAAVIREFVEFLVYCRPRATDSLVQTPVRALDPGFADAPAADWLNRDIPIPDELRALAELLRDVPLRWFNALPPLLQRLDSVPMLETTLANAKVRAQVKQAVPLAMFGGGGLLGQTITNVVNAQQQVVKAHQQEVVRLNPVALQSLSWSRSVEIVTGALSPGDLIDGRHGRAELSQMTARELDQIARAAASLYADFAQVAPSIRLDWAERLSQYDAAANLRNLSSLPRWNEIDLLERREMQAIVDWLFGRIDNREAQATAIMNDVVRVCILLASHAPVKAIITGYLPKPAVVRPGSRLTLNADISRLRVGMQVMLYKGGDVSAQGVVEDLSVQGVIAHITQTALPTLQMEANTRAQFTPGEGVFRNARQAFTLSR